MVGLTRRDAGLWALWCLGALLLAGCGGDGGDTTQETIQAAPSPTGDGRGAFALEKLGDFEEPLYVAQPSGDPHVYIVEQGGRIIRTGTDGSAPETFLDVSGEITAGGEQGLLGLAFPPDYEQSRLFYIDYTDTSGDTQIVEYRTSDDGRVDTGSARQVLTVDQPFTNHNGGQLQFDPEGNLYIGLGDGGSENDPDRNGQNLGVLLAKILRIDPEPADGQPYGIPPDNPFVKQDGARPEIYDYGLRNPWRFSFDRKTGDLWIGDVGQNEFEEVDGVTLNVAAGANFGWSAFEARAPFNDDQDAPGAIAPVLEYSHDDGCSVTGGYVVRDPSVPGLEGRYVYGDFCAGQLHSFTARPDARVRDDRPLGLEVPSLSSFGEDTDGHIYATSLEGGVYRLVQKSP